MIQSHPRLTHSRYQFEFRTYCRAFKQPLLTGHGIWRDRSGILLKLSDDTGRTGFGEIAPLEWFGSESLEQALQFCGQWNGAIATDDIFSIPDHLPACQFGLEMAWENLNHPEPQQTVPLPSSILLPTGAAALTSPLLRQQGKQPEDLNNFHKPSRMGGNEWSFVSTHTYTTPKPNSQGMRSLERTFKWKIGVAPLQDELAVFRQLLPILPSGYKLRLDANGHLTGDEAHQWLTICRDWPQIEFLEQPLAPNQLDAMQRLADQYPTAIALDESVATLAQLEACYQQGWCGIFVIKAAIAGSPARLREFCKRQAVDVVWSSVFETAIAQTFIQARLIPSVPQQVRAIGFGINHWFCDPLTGLDAEQLWQHL